MINQQTEEVISQPVLVSENNKNKRTILKSIWFWWILTTVVYLILNTGNSTISDRVAGFFGLFVPYGFLSLFVAFAEPIGTLLTIVSVIFFIFAMRWSNKIINKESNSTVKAILMSLFALLIITMVVDLIRGTPFYSWQILFTGGPQHLMSGLNHSL